MQTISADSIENFTFRIELDDDDPKTFYNFIIRQNADSTFSEPYIKKYTMSDAFYDNYSNGIETFDSFEGEFTNYSITESIDIDNLLNRSGDCLPVPIDDDTNDGPSGPANGGGGGSGDGTVPDGPGNSSGGIVTCTSSLMVIPCDAGGGHDGTDPSCISPTFKGATFLIISCSDGSSAEIQLKSANRTSGACPNDEGDVGVLGENVVLCKQLKKLLMNEDFKNQIEDLKDPSVVNNDDFKKEKGFKLYTNSSGNTDATIITTGTSNGMYDYLLGSSVIGGVHSHPKKTFPMFSVDDIIALFKFWVNFTNNGNQLITDSPVHILVSKQGVYALKIDDIAKLAIYYASMLEDENALEDERNKLERKYTKFFDEQNNQQGNAFEHQLGFLRYIQDNIGVSLYKANDDLTNWTKKEISEDNTDIINSDCP